MLNHVSKRDSNIVTISDKMKYMEIKLNKIIDQQNMLLMSLSGSSKQARGLSESASSASAESDSEECSPSQSFNKKSSQKYSSLALHDIQEEKCDGIPSPSEDEQNSFQKQRTPLQKRRDVYKGEEDNVIEASVEQVEMTIFGGNQDNDEMENVEGLSYSSSESKDFRL